MSDERPDPLVPPDVDLTGFRFMPLDTVRLLDSDLFAIATGDELKAAVALWCKAWLQKPAASLPDDDRVLAHLSSAGLRWKKVRRMAMRGFVLCSDGRWYHPLIAEKALEAWQRREDWQETQENKQSRQQRWRQRLKEVSQRLRDLGATVPGGVSLDAMERLLRDAEASTQPSTLPSTSPSTGASTSPSTGPSTVDASETGKTGTGTGTGTKILSALSEPSTDSPTRPGAVVARLRAAGCDATGANPLLLAWIDGGVTDAVLDEAIERARIHKPAPERIPLRYLDPIVRDVMSPKAPVGARAPQPETDFAKLDYSKGF